MVELGGEVMNHSKETVLKTVSELFDLVKEKQSKVDELQKQKSLQELEINQIAHANQQWQLKCSDLQKRVDAAFRVISQLNDLDDEAHKRWKREACMFSQGESNAYEHSVRLLEQALKGGCDEAK